MQEYYSNYKCYDAKGNRYAVFGRELNGKLEVYYQKCNKKDQFIKAHAKFLYHLYMEAGEAKMLLLDKLGAHPEIVLVPIEEGNSVKYIFIDFCRKNFYKKVSHMIRMEQEYLVNSDSKIKIGKPRELSFSIFKL